MLDGSVVRSSFVVLVTWLEKRCRAVVLNWVVVVTSLPAGDIQ